MLRSKIRALIGRVKAGACRLVNELATQLNVIGLGLLAYAFENRTAPTIFLDFLPESLRGVAKVIVPVAWFVLVQYSIGRAKKKAVEAAPPAAPADPGNWQ